MDRRAFLESIAVGAGLLAGASAVASPEDAHQRMLRAMRRTKSGEWPIDVLAVLPSEAGRLFDLKFLSAAVTPIMDRQGGYRVFAKLRRTRELSSDEQRHMQWLFCRVRHPKGFEVRPSVYEEDLFGPGISWTADILPV